MAERERVQKAVERPVAEAVKLLDEARGADTEKRLMMLINGWGRGLSAGLEELAIAIEEIRAGRPEGERHDTREEPTADPPAAPARADDSQEPNEEALDETGLRARAAESRHATAALREEASSELNPDGSSTAE